MPDIGGQCLKITASIGVASHEHGLLLFDVLADDFDGRALKEGDSYGAKQGQAPA